VGVGVKERKKERKKEKKERERTGSVKLLFSPWGSGTSPHNKLPIFRQNKRNSFRKKVTLQLQNELWMRTVFK